jgi:FkbM family methyltransferase
MNKIKKLIKSFFGVYATHIIKEKIHRIFKTKYYKEQVEFEKKSIDFYSQLIDENDIVFDIGANFGNRIKTFLKLKAKVIAIEPQEACCKYLRKKYCDKIILIDKAVGCDNNKKTMYISKNSAISSFSNDWIESVKSNRYKDQEWRAEEIIEQVTLDSIVEKYGVPSFIKIDVEGYELEVLKGLNEEVSVISFEYTIPEQINKAIECIDHIKEINHNVECNYSLGENMKFELENWISEMDMIRLLKGEDFSTSVGDIYVRKIEK